MRATRPNFSPGSSMQIGILRIGFFGKVQIFCQLNEIYCDVFVLFISLRFFA